MEKSGKPLVLVTGITGFLGSWTALKVVESGKYRCRASLRNAKDEKKLKTLREGFGDKLDQIELVSAELTDDAALEEAVKGCDYVLHVASPLPEKSPKNEDELIKPCVAGVESIINACDKHGVKKLVLTSTTGCIEDFSIGDVEVDEEHWIEIRGYTLPYIKSKYYAEKRAWELVGEINKKREEKKEDKFEFCTVHPSWIVGPLLIRGTGNAHTLFTQLLTGKLKKVPPYNTRSIDVRDLAQGHIRAIDCKPFKRYVMVDRHHSFQDAATWAKEEFEQYGYKVGNGQIGFCLLWMGSFFNKEAKYFYHAGKSHLRINTDMTKKEFGFQYRDSKQAILDMCYSLIKFGYVEDKTDGKKEIKN